LARLKKIEETLRRIGNASPFFGTGMHPTADGGMTVDGQMAGSGWDGDLAAGDVGTTGWAMNATRAALPELLLRPGSIGNEALTSPVVPGYLFNSISGFGLTTALTNIQTVNLTVPAGCTRLSAFIVGRVYATNNTAGLDYLYAQTNVAGYNGNALPLAVSGSNGSGTNISPFAVLLTGLTPGATITVQMAAQTAFAPWASIAGNISELNGSLNWFR
jgi:hypothetical protein